MDGEEMITPEQAKYFRDEHVLSNHGKILDKSTAIGGLGVDPDNFDKIRGEEQTDVKINEINWITIYKPDKWKVAKGITINKIKESGELLLIAHDRDELIGKPQLIGETKQTIPLVIELEKRDQDSGQKSLVYKFIDDRIDKRMDGIEKRSLEKSFYVYKVIFEDQEHMVFSDSRLDPELYTFKGMAIKMPTGTELTRTLKIRSIASLFLCKEAKSAIYPMEKKELVEFTKGLGTSIGLDYDGFRDLTFLHPDGKVYLHSTPYNLIRIAQLLSGKYEGYPLSVGNMGPLALGKTKELEALDFKFNEEKGICEAGNSTPKVLVPSFKEKPATPGYILSCARLALVDELMKMVDNANSGTRQGEAVRNSLGQLNMILEHKRRTIGSGNDNNLIAKATAKCIFSMNPLLGKSFLRDHLTILDATTMSRILWVVQDEEEQKFVRSNIPFNCGNTYGSIYVNKKDIFRSRHVTTLFYIQIYDSCQNFISDYDEARVRDLFKTSCDLVQEPMKSVWKGRGLHHTILLLDGLVKYRCLFKDYDESFVAKDEDYNLLEALVINIIKSWDTDLSGKKEDWRILK